ncbi:MAG: ABC transporter ATP-binding protein [Candidatus Brockarchaeota archaeon]|nr:ABC transporter ATP-binding protein [Candidatus Brockarchaeota archaeon]
MNKLKIKDLTAVYNTPRGEIRAVDEVSINLYSKEIFGVAGESGCGKSTLALATLRLLKPPGRIVKGEILYNDENLLAKSEEEVRLIRMKKISYIPQSSMSALNPVKKIRDQFRDMMEEHKEDSKINERISGALEMVGLKPYVADLFPHELSGGMRQRVIIAIATILRPEIVIADEPTTALDVVVQRGILEIFQYLKDKLDKTIMLITHDMAVQAEITDRIAIMYAGRIVEVGDTVSVFKQPLHPYTELLISSIPELGSEKALKGIAGFPPDLRNPPKNCRFMPRCPKATSGVCDKHEPLLVPLGNGREVACFIYGG